MPSSRYPEHSTSAQPRTRTRRDSRVSKSTSHRDRPREHHRERERDRPREHSRERKSDSPREHHREREADHHREHDHHHEDRKRDHGRDRDRDRKRDTSSRHSSKSTSSHRSPSTSTSITKGFDMLDPKLKQAMQSALTAGAVEAIRVRNKSGHWVGAKGVKVATAALGAAVIQNTANNNPDEDAKKKVAGGTVGGLVVGQLIDKLK